MPKFYTDPPKDGKVKILEVASKSKPGVFYKMRIFPDGQLVCGCPWNSIRSGECSHIRAYIGLEETVRKRKAVTKVMENTALKYKEFAADFPF